jgi:hypothetical protein
MNPDQIRTQRTVTQQLAARVAALEQLVELQARTLASFLPATADELQGLRDQIADSRAALTVGQDGVRAALLELLDEINDVAGWSLSQRLRWLVTGRR